MSKAKIKLAKRRSDLGQRVIDPILESQMGESIHENIRYHDAEKITEGNMQSEESKETSDSSSSHDIMDDVKFLMTSRASSSLRQPSKTRLENIARDRAQSDLVRDLNPVDPFTFPQSPRMRPSVSSTKRRHKGTPVKRRTLSSLSRSLDSLIPQSKHDQNAENSQSNSVSPKLQSSDEKETDTRQSISKNFSMRQVVSSPSIPFMIHQSVSSCHKLGEVAAVLGDLHVSCAVSSPSDDNDMLLVSSLHGVALAEDPNSSPCGSTAETDVTGKAVTAENYPTSNHIPKPKPVKAFDRDDLNGRLHRRMTVLSRDPKLNDKLLRKRALERQLKEKTMELEHIDQLLNRNNLIHGDLHEWLQEHPLLLKACERHLPDSKHDTDDPQKELKKNSVKYTKNEGTFLTKYINNSSILNSSDSSNSDSKNNTDNTNSNNNNNNINDHKKTEKEKQKYQGRKFFSFNSKPPSGGRKKIIRSASAPFSYFKRKSSSSYNLWGEKSS